MGTCIKLGRAKGDVGEAYWEIGRKSSCLVPSLPLLLKSLPISKQDQRECGEWAMDSEILETSSDRLQPGSRFSGPCFLILKNLLPA